MTGRAHEHMPVLVAEVLRLIAPKDGGIYVDGTFGAGGYSRAWLGRAVCAVFGVDRDPDAVRRGRALEAAFPGRFTMIEGRFGDMATLVATLVPARPVHGVALDLGVSSPQIDDPRRGFSFRRDGPLDMRMEQEGPSAADFVNGADESEIEHVVRELGEERYARRIARAILRARPIRGTDELAQVVRAAVPRAHDGIDPATRTFQALRMHVNDELGELCRGLRAAETILAPGGVLAVVAFHSLEDRAIKGFFRTRSGGAPRASRHLPPEAARAAAPSFDLLTRRPVRPEPEEIARNPRARSARLRAGRRTAAEPWATMDAAIDKESVR